MERVLTLALWGVLAVAGFGYSQEIPDGVKEYMYQLQHDSTAEYGFNFAKEWRFIATSVEFEDWYVGLPFQYYLIDLDRLEFAPADTEFKDLITPTSRWCIPIRVDSENYVYHINMGFHQEGFEPNGCGADVIGFKAWDQVRRKFPEQSGIRPIYVDFPFQLLYFPHIKNGRNIFHARNPKWQDAMSRVTSKTLNDMDDGRTIIALLKEKIKQNGWGRKDRLPQKGKYNEQPDSMKDTSGGGR